MRIAFSPVTVCLKPKVVKVEQGLALREDYVGLAAEATEKRASALEDTKLAAEEAR